MAVVHDDRVDFRFYLGILLFRWKIFAACLLYGLLGGVLYVQLAPRVYQARCTVLIHRDPNLQIGTRTSPWASYSAHVFLLTNPEVKQRAARRVAEEHARSGATASIRRPPDVAVTYSRRLPSSLEIRVSGPDREYCRVFLAALFAEHTNQWHSIQLQDAASASRLLEEELAKLEGKIAKAEDDLIEYQRLHDIARVEAKGSLESRYLLALMERHSQLSTERMMLEAQYPMLQQADAGVLSQVGVLTRETGSLRPVPEPEKLATLAREEDAAGSPQAAATAETAKTGEGQKDDIGRGWQEIRVRLATLKQREKELEQNLKPEHPQRRALRKELDALQAELDLAAQIEMNKLRDRHQAITIQLRALREAEEKWQARNLLASRRRAELNRIATVLSRYEDNYRTVYARLHDLRVSSEMRAEHFWMVEPIVADERPVWPAPDKILVVAMVLGLGVGLGWIFVLELFNNRVQSIKDVEHDIGVPFLGGVPYWARSDLEKSIRPLVTEERSAGAVEAYRALRTSVLAALNKRNETALIVTSADSREGKTLTVLNLAILVAQLGRKVLLVDLDLRRGRLHRSLGMDRSPGMTDVLAGRAGWADVVRPTHIENLDFVPSGTQEQNCTELLQSVNLKDLLGSLRDRYAYILMDTSPVLRVTDTTILVGQGIGAVAYVACADHTPKPLIRYSISLLKDAPIIGLILNRIDLHRIGSLYYAYQYPNYAYYSYAYSYGYDSYHYSDERGPRRKRGGKETGPNGRERTRRLRRWLRQTFLPLD